MNFKKQNAKSWEGRISYNHTGWGQLWGRGSGAASWAGFGSRDRQQHLGLQQQEHSEELGQDPVPSTRCQSTPGQHQFGAPVQKDADTRASSALQCSGLEPGPVSRGWGWSSLGRGSFGGTSQTPLSPEPLVRGGKEAAEPSAAGTEMRGLRLALKHFHEDRQVLHREAGQLHPWGIMKPGWAKP